MEIDTAQLDEWTRASFSPALNEREKMIRDKFVEEFMHDYIPKLAALRCGFAEGFAEDYARKFMLEPYVQQQIKARELGEGITTDDERDRATVKQALRREMIIGSPSSRVSAAIALGKYAGLEPATKTISEVTVKSAVQFYLPHNGRDPLPDGANVVTENAAGVANG